MSAPRLGEEKLLPRDPALRAHRIQELRRLYETEQLGVVAIAERFGVQHCSVRRAMKRYGIKARKAGIVRNTTCCEPGCNLPIFSIRHAKNGCWYGRRCRLHWIVYRIEVNQRYNDRHLGKDDESWLRRMRQLLARVQRAGREVSLSLKGESQQETTSRGACPH